MSIIVPLHYKATKIHGVTLQHTKMNTKILPIFEINKKIIINHKKLTHKK